MSDQDLFNTTTTKEEPATTGTPAAKPVQPETNPLLAMIVNQDGKPKYQSVEDALKGAAHAQVHISNLEKELAELRSKSENSTKIEDLMAILKTSKESTTNSSEEKKVNQPDIYEVVKSVLSEVTTKSTQEQNIKTVTGKFKELYGEKASETLYGKANDLGMSKTDINALIAANPKAAFKLLGIDESTKESTPAPKVNAEGFQGTPPPKPKSVMGYTSTKELTASWLDSKKRTLIKLGIEK